MNQPAYLEQQYCLWCASKIDTALGHLAIIMLSNIDRLDAIVPTGFVFYFPDEDTAAQRGEVTFSGLTQL